MASTGADDVPGVRDAPSIDAPSVEVPSIGVRRAEPADRDALSGTLADAFANDPVWAWMVPPPNRDHRLKLLFAQLLGHALRQGTVLTTLDRSAVAMWSPPGQWKLPLPRLLASTIPIMRASRHRLPRLVRRLAEVEREHGTKPADHWYLELLGTARTQQGRGLGAALMGAMLPQIDSANLPAYLESSNPRNLPFYQRHGFRVTGQIAVSAGPPHWTLWRDPQAGSG